MVDMVAFGEEVRRLFCLSRIKKIECEILKLYQEGERRRDSYRSAFAISKLLYIRKFLLEEEFTLNER